MNRLRVAYALATVSLVAVGLFTRLPLIAWPDGLGKYLGAVLWGAMVYCIVRLISPSARLTVCVAVAISVAALIELSQLWHTPWLDAFRSTIVGVLLLGRYFAWADIATYGVGVGIAAGLDVVSGRRRYR
jgi:hypothetical protein